MLCGQRAEQALAGLGDAALGEWREWAGVYHLRRRLSTAEAARVGDPLDIRGTDEARRRAAAIPARLLRALPAHVLAMELG